MYTGVFNVSGTVLTCTDSVYMGVAENEKKKKKDQRDHSML